MKTILLTILICLIPLTSFAQEEANSSVRNIAPEYQLKEEDFTYEEYQEYLKWLEGIFEQCRKGDELGWEIENLGLSNSLLALEGYGLLTQRDVIRLKLENAKLSGTEEEIADLKKPLDKIERQIEVFLSEKYWYD